MPKILQKDSRVSQSIMNKKRSKLSPMLDKIAQPDNYPAPDHGLSMKKIREDAPNEVKELNSPAAIDRLVNVRVEKNIKPYMPKVFNLNSEITQSDLNQIERQTPRYLKDSSRGSVNVKAPSPGDLMHIFSLKG